MKDDLDHWRTFWGNQTSPLHRHDTEFYYQLYAEELNLIFRRFGFAQGSVLESGCGNGALFPYLNINRDDYTGMDISYSLLDQFRTNHPNVTLIEDSAENIPNRQFQLIFSNALGQYFHPKQMEQYIKNASSRLEPGGLLIIGNLLWRSARSRFQAGVYADIANQSYRQLKTLRSNVRAWLSWWRDKPDTMGYWVEPEDVLKLIPTQQNTIVGSIFYPYRFTLVVRRPGT